MLRGNVTLVVVVAATQLFRVPSVLGDPKEQREPTTRPAIIHLCLAHCFTLTWKGDKYVAPHVNGGTGYSVYTVERFGPDSVVMHRTTYTPDGKPTSGGTLTGSIAPGGTRIVGGVYRWDASHDPPAKFEASWGSALEVVPGSDAERTNRGSASTSGAASDQGAAKAQAKPNKHVELPPGAAPVMATYPDEVRAILQPAAPLPLSSANLPCPSDEVVSPSEAYEIGKYAYRAAEYERGRCWLERSANSGIARAHVLLAVSLVMGWGVPKDATAAFNLFKRVAFQTHDVWALYFLEECYEYGIGTAVDKRMQARVEMMYDTHPDALAVQMLIRSDEPEFRQQRDRDWADLVSPSNPPTKEVERCVRNQASGEVSCFVRRVPIDN